MENNNQRDLGAGLITQTDLTSMCESAFVEATPERLAGLARMLRIAAQDAIRQARAEWVSAQRERNQEDERTMNDEEQKVIELARNRARAEWETNDNSVDYLVVEITSTAPRKAGGFFYHVSASALIVSHEGDAGTEEMTMTIHFDSDQAIFSDIKSTLFAED